MGRAEDRALERFPVHEGASKEWIEMHLKGVCAEYIEGYHQAEKDLELTWEDIDWIVGEAVCRVSEDSEAEKICKEVLKRFKERREVKGKG